MKLTKLEINGFKSFAKKTELVFEEGITGILGPNGCGKSNIADAFRFVLGEQSARALRGKKIEDFIFGGTEKRRPLSYCEASLTFDNSDGVLATPYSEVVVTRRAYRSGESEYYINKTQSRLKDIQELFRDTGIGKDGYSLIGQGRVSEILSDRSGERRVVFEEAAGVMKYRTRKEEAERKLQNTEKNLERLTDILRELESRLEPLRIQSEKASEYFKMREELRELELNIFIHQYERSAERVRTLNETAAQLENELSEANGEEQSCAAVCAEEESAERRLSAAISDCSQKLISLSAAVESELGNEKLLRERINSLQNNIKKAEAETAAICENEADHSERLAVLDGSVSGLSSDAAALEKALEEARAAFAALSNEIGEKEALLEARKQAMMDTMNRLADTRSRVSRLEAMRDALEKRLESIGSERRATENEGKKLDDELSVIKEEFALSERERTGAQEAYKNALSEASEINARIVREGKKLRSAEDEINAISSRLKVLEEMKRAHEGYYTSVRRLLNDANRDPSLGSRIHGVVAELISVPKEYERAVEMALGAALQNIIVPTEQDAKAVINYLRAKDYGRATLLPVSAMRARLLTAEERNCIRVEGCFGVASELIGFSPAFRGVIENLLGRTVIVRDIDTGILINKRAGHSFRIATLEGDILNPGGSMTGGSVQKREVSLLGRVREIEELEARRSTAKERVKQLSESLKSAQSALADSDKNVSAISERLKKAELELASGREKLDITSRVIQKNNDTLAKLGEEAARITDSIADLDEQYSEANRAESAINADTAVSNDDIRASQQQLAELRRELQKANEEQTALAVRQMASVKEQSAASAEIERLKRERASFGERKAQLASGIESDREAIRGIELQLSELGSSIGVDRGAVTALTDELHAMEQERASHLKLLDETRERHENCLARIGELKERLHRNELSESKLKGDLENMADRIWQDYELTYENALPFRKQLPAAQMHLRSDALRRSIKELGEVNTSAIEDYRSVSERYEDLSEQCSDLIKAKQDLTELIDKLTETMQTEFTARFEQIRANFSETFRELFGGGRAELALADKSDALNSNIDIIAQPPGKKLQLLSLLSGGEQALTAIALLFAILKLKPAAFCILDEIDTSLDEANVDNFAGYLKRYASGTQFIIITHRKGAMAVCDSLYGVSMEEKGVSSIISAKFD